MAYLTLIIGFAVLASAGEFLVRGSVLLADRLGVSPLIIGLTIVAFGTSAPEMVVSIGAVVEGKPGIAIGNVVGSNIANVLLVLGLPAMIKASHSNDGGISRSLAYMLGASVLFIALCFYGSFTFWQGALLFSLVIIFLVDSARQATGEGSAASEYEEEAQELIGGAKEAAKSIWLILLLIVVGVAGLPVGAHMTVSGASEIAAAMGVSNAAIALTAVALGTSLPELVTTISCTLRNHGSMAFGNILGSNIFNILAVMGAAAMLGPIPVPEAFLRVDLWVMLGAAIVVIPFALGKATLTRLPATGFLVAYLVYVVFALTPHGGV